MNPHRQNLTPARELGHVLGWILVCAVALACGALLAGLPYVW